MKIIYSLSFAASAAGLWLTQQAMAGGADTAASAGAIASGYKEVGFGYAAAATMAMCVLGSAYAIARIGSAAMGAAAEKPELLMRSLLFVALAEGLAVLGFVIAMVLIGKI